MADSILEQILAAFGIRLSEILTANGYETDIGSEVLRHFLPPINYEYVPCVGYTAGTIENSELYTRKESNDLPVSVQGVAGFTSDLPASKMAVKIHADICECILTSEYTINFQSGGTTPIIAGNVIEGAGSGATGLVIEITVTSGSWGAGNASGYIIARRVSGTFISGENLNVGATPNLATVNGNPTGSGPVSLVTNGLADMIGFNNSQFFMPESDHRTVGVRVVFGIKYKLVSGNPYSQ